MLASLKSISSFQNRKKVSSKSPFSLKRPDPASPHPYATPTPVFDIGESSYEELVPDAASSSRIHDSTPIHLAEPIASPRVEVDIDVTPADWFPSHFLRTDSVAAPRSLAGAAAVIAESSTASKSVDTLQTDDLSDDEDEDTSTTSEDDVVSNLEAMDASNFVNLPVPTSDGLMAQSTDSPVMGPRKGAGKGVPAPIKIPNASLHGPRVQIVRSSTAQSRPDSMFSFDGTSAVSGTTLARALIGDTYVLSGDRSSKYRSGASVLTRSDSATLPRGEHPFSPAWSIRKSGAFTPVDGMGVAIPPVPQMPEELRRVIAESRDRLKVDEAGERRRSRRRSGSDVETPVTPLVRTNSGSRISGSSSDDARLEKRVSRISEAPTPISAALLTPDLPSATDSAAGNTDPSPNTSSFHAGGASPSSFPTSPGQSSTAASGRYSQDIDNVLDYYNFEPSPGYSGGASSSAFDLPSPDIPADPNRYHPAFSPITEESGSQLSPNSFRSRRTNGKLSLASTPSPSTGGGRVEWRQGELRSLPLHPLLPIGDRPRSASVTPSPIIIPGPPLLTASNSYPSLPSPPSPTHETLEPPSRSFFNRQRSGSAPSPIQVIRDPRDFNAYNITVTPARFSTSSNSSTPVSPESENVLVRQQQTFPETPSAFSPTFSPETAANRNSMIPPPVPAVAGAVPRAGFGSLAQQMLLTRAATTVRGARHSRQASMTRARNRSTAIFPSAQTANMLKEALVENGVVSPDDETGPGVDSLVQEKVEEEEEAERDDEDATPRADEEQLKSSEAGHGAPSSPPISEESASVYSPSVRSFSSPPQQSRSIHRLSKSDDTHWNSLEGVTEDYYEKPLPAMPNSPAEPEPVIPPPPPPEPIVEVAPSLKSSLKSSSSSSLSRPSGPSVSPTPSQPLQPLSPSRRSSVKSTHSSSPPEHTEEAASSAGPSAAPSPPAITELVITEEPRPASPPHQLPPLALTSSSLVDPPPGSPHLVPVLTPLRSGSGDSPQRSAFGSPPPYYTVMYDRETGRDSERVSPNDSPSTPSIPLRDQRSLSVQSLMPTTPGGPGRRARARPPLPVGPRRPTTPGPSGLPPGRNRNGSVSSIQSSNNLRRLTSTSPRFQTPPLRWRGYTMDAAKWTFSSSQLQGIVSRAIKQSAEASSIRLLRLETVDQDIPDELHRLEMQRTDVKTRYKMLTRRRTNLLATLTGLLDGTEQEDSTYALRIVENLKELSSELDQLAEDLHSADEQIAQLSSLRDVHSASALAMALRKLNASFLKQIAEAETLRTQVETLQAERDEAWSQAENVANEFDDLSERMEISSPGPSSYNKRSSRVLAVKKSSIRVSKAGLRSSSRRSSVSSISGHRVSSSGLPSATMEDIPPVPPMPRRRPDDIRTDIALVSRVSALSTTPTSETRALDRAQEELYNMLGLSVPERARRSHSVIMSAGSDLENPILSASSRPRSEVSRPSSLPGNSALSEALSAMTADRNAMLATLGMLDD